MCSPSLSIFAVHTPWVPLFNGLQITLYLTKLCHYCLSRMIVLWELSGISPRISSFIFQVIEDKRVSCIFLQKTRFCWFAFFLICVSSKSQLHRLTWALDGAAMCVCFFLFITLNSFFCFISSFWRALTTSELWEGCVVSGLDIHLRC